MEEFEELKENLMRKMYYHNMVPDEVFSILNRVFNKVQRIYSDYGVLTMSIEEYIHGEMAQVNSRVNRLNQNKKEEQVEDLKYILNKMEQELEELQTEPDEKSEEDGTRHNREQYYRQEIEGMDTHNKRVSSGTVQQLEDSLNSIRSAANRIMSSRGVSDREIEEINYEIRSILYHLPEQEEEIFAVLRADDANMLKTLIDEYDVYLSQSRMTEHQKFVQGIKVSEDELALNTPSKEQDSKERETENSLEDWFI